MRFFANWICSGSFSTGLNNDVDWNSLFWMFITTHHSSDRVYSTYLPIHQPALGLCQPVVTGACVWASKVIQQTFHTVTFSASPSFCFGLANFLHPSLIILISFIFMGVFLFVLVLVCFVVLFVLRILLINIILNAPQIAAAFILFFTTYFTYLICTSCHKPSFVSQIVTQEMLWLSPSRWPCTGGCLPIWAFKPGFIPSQRFFSVKTPKWNGSWRQEQPSQF